MNSLRILPIAGYFQNIRPSINKGALRYYFTFVKVKQYCISIHHLHPSNILKNCFQKIFLFDQEEQLSEGDELHENKILFFVKTWWWFGSIYLWSHSWKVAFNNEFSINTKPKHKNKTKKQNRAKVTYLHNFGFWRDKEAITFSKYDLLWLGPSFFST